MTGPELNGSFERTGIEMKRPELSGIERSWNGSFDWKGKDWTGSDRIGSDLNGIDRIGAEWIMSGKDHLTG